MQDISLALPQFFVGIGGILLVGAAVDFIGRRSIFPRVTLLLVMGILIGDRGLAIIPPLLTENFELAANIALMVVGFLLGAQFELQALKLSSKDILWISIIAALFTLLFVSFGLLFTHLDFALIILLASIASATAPAPIVDIILEKQKPSIFSSLLLKIVALDDIWALLLFSIGLATMTMFYREGSGLDALFHASYHLLGALLLGTLIGIPAAYLTGRIRPGQPTLVEALGLVFTCGGLANWLDVSFLIAVMTMGAMITNMATHHEYPFHEIENIEWPFMVIFFVLAGASLDVSALKDVTWVAVIYVAFRSVGKYLGAWLGAKISGAPKVVRNWIGLAMLPQAGVEIGMALIAANQFAEYAQTILSLVISSTIFFELIGPILTRIAIGKADNALEPPK
ncbi:cation:proton antiporter [Aliiglaciecola sp. LCG003]|uniref:cation:proton antiporter n=1 Tax=Aliiglaciecola sp. LCG003 TaxID=3053655 RepID=UPI0025734A66|nr:cation:proton antiporter [Aliiglaciecola sp. LCG003]WJG10787.1 cation:proton antiporter [Aliiglaciecola sp. LCG003]